MPRTHPLNVLLLLLALFALAACGSAKGTPRPTVELIPTPQGSFGQATTVMSPAKPEGPTGSVVAPDLLLGQRVWDGKCAGCHGVQGEGVPGKGKGVEGWQFGIPEFTDLLRTGQKGKLGSEHLFGPSQISPAGVEALFSYAESLAQ